MKPLSSRSVPHFLRVTRALALLPALTVPFAVVAACGGDIETGGGVLAGPDAGDAHYNGEASGVYNGGDSGVAIFDGSHTGVDATGVDAVGFDVSTGVSPPPDGGDAGDGGPLMPPELPA